MDSGSVDRIYLPQFTRSLEVIPCSARVRLIGFTLITCKHIVHYDCIDDPRKLCPICPSTDMEPEEEMDVDGEEQPDTSSKK
jgi:hypothetical protein